MVYCDSLCERLQLWELLKPSACTLPGNLVWISAATPWMIRDSPQLLHGVFLYMVSFCASSCLLEHGDHLDGPRPHGWGQEDVPDLCQHSRREPEGPSCSPELGDQLPIQLGQAFSWTGPPGGGQKELEKHDENGGRGQGAGRVPHCQAPANDTFRSQEREQA